jgi:WD40 repeat protein
VIIAMAADPTKLSKPNEISRREIVLSLARVPQSNRLYCGGSDFKVYAWDVSGEKKPVAEMAGHESYVTGLALAGKQLVSGSYDGKLIWWDAESHKQVRAIDAHPRWIRQVTATPDGKVIVSVADDMVCRLWDAASGKMLHELRGHAESTPHHYPSMLYACAVSADGRLVATGDRIGHVIVWEIASGKRLAELDAPVMYTWDPRQRRHSIGGIRSLAFSRGGSLLAVGGMGKVNNIDHLEGLSRIEIFDWQAGKQTHLSENDKFKGLVEDLAFGPGDDWLVAVGGDHGGFVQFYDLKAKKILHQDKAPSHVHALALSESAETLYAAAHGRILWWDLKT